MSAYLYLEGGAHGTDSSDLDVECRRAFTKLLERCGFGGRLPRIVASGGRGAVYEDFKNRHARGNDDFVAMLLDSEEPPDNPEAPWDHLKKRDGWKKPEGAADDQVLLMITCMETWIVADRDALDKHYGSELKASVLPPLVDLERRDRHDIQQRLINATRRCSNAYVKGKQSYLILAKLDPQTLERQKLTGFVRMRQILDAKLK